MTANMRRAQGTHTHGHGSGHLEDDNIYQQVFFVLKGAGHLEYDNILSIALETSYFLKYKRVLEQAI